MKYQAFWRCDLCNCKFDTSKEVRSDVSMMNGTYSRIYGDVCDDCMKKVAKLIDAEFPRNKAMLKKEERVTEGQPV